MNRNVNTVFYLKQKQFLKFHRFDRERELIFRRAIGICSFYDVDCEDIFFDDGFLDSNWVQAKVAIQNNIFSTLY
jgi:hypothetical protein